MEKPKKQSLPRGCDKLEVRPYTSISACLAYIFLGRPMTPETKARIDQLVTSSKIFVFMKGNRLMPQCGFSNNVVQILNILGVPYETADVLADPEIRDGIKLYSQWPTIPQVYINGEFVGGSDILIELYKNGELQQMVEVALAS
jgi:monothiol glutaredoxin